MIEEPPPSTLRVDPHRLWSWVSAAHKRGFAVRSILEAVLGADLPQEAYAFARSWPRDLELPIDCFFHPWAILTLGTPRGANVSLDDYYANLERVEVEGNSDFLPLMSLQAGEVLGDVIGYSLEHLQRSDPSVFWHSADKSSSNLEKRGASLLEVLHTWITEYHRIEKAQVEAPENRRTASDDYVKLAAQWLKELEKLQRKVAQG